MARNSKQRENEAAGYITHTVRKQRELDACYCSALLL